MVTDILLFFFGYLVLKRTQGDTPFLKGSGIWKGRNFLVEVDEKAAKFAISVWKAWKG